MFEFKTIGNEDKPALIMFHGFMGEYHDLLKLANILKKHYFCALINLPGHGNTPIGNFVNHDFDYLIKCLDTFINTRFKKPSLFGYSMGGRIAIELFVKSNQYKNCFIESASFGLKTKKDQDERFKNDLILQEKLLSIKNKLQLLHFYNNWYQAEIWNNILTSQSFKKKLNIKMNKINLQCLRNHAKALILMGQFRQNNLFERFEKKQNYHKANFYYIHGLKDQKYSKIAQNLQKVQNTSLLALKDQGHNCHHACSVQIADFIINSNLRDNITQVN